MRHRGGTVTPFTGESFARTAQFVASEIARICGGFPSDVVAVHDVSGGGVAQAILEMASASECGIESNVTMTSAEMLTETPGRFVLATKNLDALRDRAERAGVAILELGVARGTRVVLGASLATSLDEVKDHRRDALERRLRAAG